MFDANRLSGASELKDVRDVLYDVAKGVGIILVIYGHMFGSGHVFGSNILQAC